MHSNSRRRVARLLGVGALSLLLLRTPLVDAQPSEPLQSLLTGTYVGDLQLKTLDGMYLGNDFKLSSAPAQWTLRVGQYERREGFFKKVSLYGYWIYRPDGKHCWKAENGEGPGLVFWNLDGKSKGPPEDWELFRFVLGADANLRIVLSRSPTTMLRLKGNQFGLAPVGSGKEDVSVPIKVVFLSNAVPK